MTIRSEVVLPSTNLSEDISFFTKKLGLRMEMIYPADDPRVVVLSGHGLRLRIEQGGSAAPGFLRLLSATPDLIAEGAWLLTAPNGTRIEIENSETPLILPETQHKFVVRRLADQAPWVIGRAGMQYRDLIPDRLGGSIIASHIRIPDGGPVPDMVHYHTVGFQLIFCYRGWVDLVYEDQGAPFRLYAGNCVIQPPEIRHKVLFASDNIEVIEIGVPAEHITTIDHELQLPNGPVNPKRRFSGQQFVHHRAEAGRWMPSRLAGFDSRDTTIAAHTQNIAGVHVLKANGGLCQRASHNADILFSFVMEGAMTLQAEGEQSVQLTAGDAFVIPPGMLSQYFEISEDCELLEVALPGNFTTDAPQ